MVATIWEASEMKEPLGKNQIVKRLLELSVKEGAAKPPLEQGLIKWELICAPFYRFKKVVEVVKRGRYR